MSEFNNSFSVDDNVIHSTNNIMLFEKNLSGCPECKSKDKTIIVLTETVERARQIEVPEYDEWTEIVVCKKGHPYYRRNASG